MESKYNVRMDMPFEEGKRRKLIDPMEMGQKIGQGRVFEHRSGAGSKSFWDSEMVARIVDREDLGPEVRQKKGALLVQWAEVPELMENLLNESLAPYANKTYPIEDWVIQRLLGKSVKTGNLGVDNVLLAEKKGGLTGSEAVIETRATVEATVREKEIKEKLVLKVSLSNKTNFKGEEPKLQISSLSIKEGSTLAKGVAKVFGVEALIKDYVSGPNHRMQKDALRGLVGVFGQRGFVVSNINFYMAEGGIAIEYEVKKIPNEEKSPTEAVFARKNELSEGGQGVLEPLESIQQMEEWKCSSQLEQGLKSGIDRFLSGNAEDRKPGELESVLEELEKAGIVGRIVRDIEGGVANNQKYWMDGRFNPLTYLDFVFGRELNRIIGFSRSQLDSEVLSDVVIYLRKAGGEESSWMWSVNQEIDDWMDKRKNGKKEGRMDERKNMMQAADYFKMDGRRRFTEELGSSVVMASVDAFIEGGSGETPKTWHGKPMVDLWVKLTKGAEDCTPFLDAVRTVLAQPDFATLSSEKAMERVASALAIQGSDRLVAEEYALVLDLFNRAKLDKNAHPIIMKKTRYLLLGD